MPEAEKIEIINLQVKTGVKNGKPWSITNVTDGRTKRVGSIFSDNAVGWKVGDIVDGIWEKGEPYNGQEQWKIKNPSAKKSPFQGGGGRSFNGPTTPMIVHAYLIATDAAKSIYAGKNPKLADIDAMAQVILVSLNKSLPPQPSAEAAKPEEKAAVKTAPAPKKEVAKQEVEEEGFEETTEEEEDMAF